MNHLDLDRLAACGIVVAPQPDLARVNEGWMSRIAAIERMLEEAELPRFYLNPHHQDDRSPEAVIRADARGQVEVKLDARWSGQYRLLRDLVLRAPWIYVHTVHLARFLVPFLDRARVFVDVHGIAPEEEALYGNMANASFFEEVERAVWQSAAGVACVTDAMRIHLAAKHGPRAGPTAVLPIFEGAERPARAPAPAGPATVLYSGGAQRWQCVDDMIDLVAKAPGGLRWVFLSHEPHEFEGRLSARGLASRAEIRSVRKRELAPLYLAADYGLVLRDPIAVNRVSCPTKLVEYLAYGMIPVVKDPNLGDFLAAGYRTVSVDDVRAGRLPGTAEREQMRRDNYAALDRLADAFDTASDAVIGWLRGAAAPAAGTRSLAHLSTLELVSGATAFSEVYELLEGGGYVYTKVNSAAWEDEKRFPLSGKPFRELRFRPLPGAFRARVLEARFLDVAGRAVEAVVDCRGSLCAEALCVSTPNVPGDVYLRPAGGVTGPFRELVVRVQVLADGPEAGGLQSHERPTDDAVRRALGEVRGSRVWRVVLRLGEWRDWATPPGSERRRLGVEALRALRRPREGADRLARTLGRGLRHLVHKRPEKPTPPASSGS